MKNISTYIQIYLLLFLFIVITPCNGQNETHPQEDSVIESNTIPNDPLVKENQPTIQTAIDPLFYIDGQLCQHVRKIFQDKSGNLWFGTNVYGLMRYNGDSLEYFSEKDGLGAGRITGIVEDSDGNVWFGSYGGLTKYDGKTFTNFSEKDGMINHDVWSLIIDSNGILWIGTIEGVCRFDGEEFTSLPIPKAHVKDTTSILSYNRISCIMEDRNGIFWIGTDGFGICKYDPSDSPGPDEKSLPVEQADFTHITKEDGLCDNNVTHILEDKKGNIWIGTMFGGISLYDGKSFTNFTENGVTNGIEVWSIYEDKTGNIWFPAENHGVYRYNGISFNNFNEKDGLNTNGIQSIFEDNEGRYWFGGWGGLFRFDPSASFKTDGKSFFSVTREGPWE